MSLSSRLDLQLLVVEQCNAALSCVQNGHRIRVLLKHPNVLFCVIFIVVNTFKYSFGIQSCSRVCFKDQIFILQSFARDSPHQKYRGCNLIVGNNVN